MSEYKPTEYVVDFGDCRSNRFVGLNMTLIKQNGAKLQERIVRCGDCKFFTTNIHGSYCTKSITTLSDSNGFCAWGERRNNE